MLLQFEYRKSIDDKHLQDCKSAQEQMLLQKIGVQFKHGNNRDSLFDF
jgi:hypothetical protein